MRNLKKNTIKLSTPFNVLQPRLLIPLVSDSASLMNDLGRFTTDEYYGNMDGLNII